MQLTDITWVTDTRAWTVGEKGLIYKTEDAGETWQREEVPLKVPMKSIAFLDESYGWQLEKRVFLSDILMAR